jgi:hypothetical protein
MSEQQVKIFLVDDAYIELEDAYVDKEKDLRAEVFSQIKTLCKSAKMSKVNKTLVVNLKETDEESGQRKMKQDTVPMDEVDLDKYPVKFDPEWLPEKMKKEDSRTYTQKVGDNTWKYLKYFYQIYCARIDKYNDSLEMPKEESEKAKLPACFEQVIHEQLVQALNQIIAKNIEKEFDAEFKEINAEQDNKKPKAGSREKKP